MSSPHSRTRPWGAEWREGMRGWGHNQRVANFPTFHLMDKAFPVDSVSLPPSLPTPFPSIWSCALPPFCPLSSRRRSGFERQCHGPGRDGIFPPFPKEGRGPACNVSHPVLLLTMVGPNHQWVRVLKPTVITGQFSPGERVHSFLGGLGRGPPPRKG